MEECVVCKYIIKLCLNTMKAGVLCEQTLELGRASITAKRNKFEQFFEQIFLADLDSFFRPLLSWYW